MRIFIRSSHWFHVSPGGQTMVIVVLTYGQAISSLKLRTIQNKIDWRFVATGRKKRNLNTPGIFKEPPIISGNILAVTDSLKWESLTEI